jgi:hypothetical protein
MSHHEMIAWKAVFEYGIYISWQCNRCDFNSGNFVKRDGSVIALSSPKIDKSVHIYANKLWNPDQVR